MASHMAAQANLDRYQCMFTWNKEIVNPIESQWVVDTLEDKLCTSDCEWQSIVYHLVLAYECHLLNKHPAARDHLVSAENIILDSECFVASSLVQNNLVAIKHVLHSTWIHLVNTTESFNVLQDYLSEIALYTSMTKMQKAGVVAIHAACLMEYGLKGNILASDLLQQAIKYDEHQGHWHFLRGEALRYERLSNLEHDDLSHKQEIKCFELAHFYDEHTPSHCITLASSLYDSVKHEKKPSKIRDRATELYKTALNNWPNSAYVNLMCASGLLYYAYPVRHTQLADQCLGKALKLAPHSAHVNLVAGAFFKWPSKNEGYAIRHFNLAKRRYSSLVDQILKGDISNYRLVLIKGIVDPAPLRVLLGLNIAVEEEDEHYIDMDNDYDYDNDFDLDYDYDNVNDIDIDMENDYYDFVENF